MPQFAPRTESRAWRHLYKLRAYREGRLRFLDANPLCVWCKKRGEFTEATVVNHKKPHKGNKHLFLDKRNWESVCTHCHNTICKAQDAGRPIKGIDANGMPLDPNHWWNTAPEGGGVRSTNKAAGDHRGTTARNVEN